MRLARYAAQNRRLRRTVLILTCAINCSSDYSFQEAERFDWQTARVMRDTRMDYGETRYIAQGFIGQRLHILIFTLRAGRARIISLRKSNPRERKSYGQAR